MTITLLDDKGREATVEGEWTARMIGADHGGVGQIMVWLKPGPEGWLEPVVKKPEIAAPTRAQELARESRATPTNIKQIAEGN